MVFVPFLPAGISQGVVFIVVEVFPVSKVIFGNCCVLLFNTFKGKENMSKVFGFKDTHLDMKYAAMVLSLHQANLETFC